MAQAILADGFVNLCIDPSLNFYEGKCRMLIEGQADGSAELDKVTPVISPRDIDARFGVGTVLSLALKKAFCMCPSNVEIFAIPRADPVGATAATQTWTFTGTAESDGRVEIFLLDKDFSVNVFVEEGFTPSDVAAAVADALPYDFPYTAAVAGGVITLTAISAGAVGNYLIPVYNWQGRLNYAPVGVEFEVTGAVEGVGDITPLDYQTELGICCYNVFALLGDGSDYQEAWQRYIEGLWSCDTPQCFGHGYTYNTGTLGQILARDTNAETLSRMAYDTGNLSPPWLGVAAFAALSACSACENPELSIQGRQYGVLSCLLIPETCISGFTFDEQEQLKEAGFVVTGPMNNGNGAYTSPYVFNDVTNSRYDELNRPNATYRDASSRRLLAATSLTLATELQRFSGLSLFTKNTKIRPGIFGTNVRMMTADIRAWAKSNIGILFSEFEDIDRDIVLRSDSEVAPKCQGDPTKLHLFFRYRQPVRIGQIVTTLQPKLLDNCNR